MIENLIVSVGIISLNFFVAYFLRAIHRTWLAPSAMYALWWSVTSLVSILVGYREHIPIVGLLWILLSSIVIGAGSLVVKGRNETIDDGVPTNLTIEFPISKLKSLKYIYIIVLFLAFSYIVTLLMFQNMSLSDLASLEGFLILAAKFSKERYEDVTVLPMYIKLLLPFSFFANCLGGALFAITKRRIYLLCMIPPVIISTLFTEKSGVLFCFSMWISSFMTIFLYNKNLVVFNANTIIRSLIMTFCVSVVLIFSAFARMGDLNVGLVQDVIDKLYSSLFGHVAAFSNWLEQFDLNVEKPAFGKYTFAGLVDFFGISKREQGLYTVNYQLANGELTNLYTIHKGLILDFSAAGALIVYFLFGIAGQFFFKCVYLKMTKFIGLIASVYSMIFVSLFVSILIFNTTFLAICMNILLFLVL